MTPRFPGLVSRDWRTRLVHDLAPAPGDTTLLIVTRLIDGRPTRSGSHDRLDLDRFVTFPFRPRSQR